MFYQINFSFTQLIVNSFDSIYFNFKQWSDFKMIIVLLLYSIFTLILSNFFNLIFKISNFYFNWFSLNLFLLKYLAHVRFFQYSWSDVCSNRRVWYKIAYSIQFQLRCWISYHSSRIFFPMQSNSNYSNWLPMMIMNNFR